MKCQLILASAVIFVASVYSLPSPESKATYLSTPIIIKRDGYPVKTYQVQTSDSYVLTIFRIPYSPRLNNKKVPNKPVVFLQHGLLSSSDCWILNGPEDSLAYMLANAGYDVWLGNMRGNRYSKKNAAVSSLLPKFWNFSWHEAGLFDLSAMVDFVLYTTGREQLHYIAHSQGTTAFFVLNSMALHFNAKFASAQLLAPVGYMDNMRSPIGTVGGPLLGNPSLLSKLFGSNEFLPHNGLYSLLGQSACREKSRFKSMCSNMLFLICGWDSEYFNESLHPMISTTHPAGASTSQVVHYLQEYESGFFRQFDHGRSNKKVYKPNKTPPSYEVENITVPTFFYYTDNDLMAEVSDVFRLYNRLNCTKSIYNIPIKKYNHLDFLFAVNVREIVNEPVLAVIRDFENGSSAE